MKKYWVGLTKFPKFGPVRIKKLTDYFPTIKEAFLADFLSLKKAGIEEKIAQEFTIVRNNINLDQEMEKIEKENINIITINDDSYPFLLKETFTPPPVLYIKGNLNILEDLCIGIVGSRKISPYGKQITPEIATELGVNNITVVSGLALGVDTLSHIAAIESGGKTIAVLGSGLDNENLYPSSNRYLAAKIIDNGSTIISEHPIGTLPLKRHFPTRNRIISGLSIGTLVVEAAESSGALITAKYALEQNREIFAVPGSIYSPMSAGTNKLLKSGAHLVTNAGDILEVLNLREINKSIQEKNIKAPSPEEEIIFKHLTKEPMHINKLVQLTNLDTPSVSATLSIMEMKGLVKNLGGMNYVLK